MVEGSPVTGAQPWGTDDDGGQWKGIRQDAVRRIGVRRESDAQSQVPKPKMGTGDARAEQRSGVVANVTHDPMLYKMPFFQTGTLLPLPPPKPVCPGKGHRAQGLGETDTSWSAFKHWRPVGWRSCPRHSRDSAGHLMGAPCLASKHTAHLSGSLRACRAGKAGAVAGTHRRRAAEGPAAPPPPPVLSPVAAVLPVVLVGMAAACIIARLGPLPAVVIAPVAATVAPVIHPPVRGTVVIAAVG